MTDRVMAASFFISPLPYPSTWLGLETENDYLSGKNSSSDNLRLPVDSTQ